MINNFTNTNLFILSPEWYSKALYILKNKIKKPLNIYFFTNSQINSKLLFKYIEVLNKYGTIINNFDNKYSQIDYFIIMSKMNHYIGPKNFIHLGSYIYAQKNSITITNSNNTINNIYKKENYPSNWIFLNDKNYRIFSMRDLNRYQLDILINLKEKEKKTQYNINSIYINLFKKDVELTYKDYYKNFDKLIYSKFLKNLLLYKIYKTKNNIYYLNSNISINEGIFLYNLINKYNPKKILEIGFACGISSAFILTSMNKNSILKSVDPFQKIYWDGFGLNVVKEILKEKKLKSNNHEWISNYSHTYFKNNKEKFDFCFIDGDHSYKGTMIDLIGCNKILELNGILVIDDVLHKDVKKALNDFFKINNNYKKIEYELYTMNAYEKINITKNNNMINKFNLNKNIKNKIK